MNESAVLEAPPPLSPTQMDHISFSSIKTYQTCPRKFAYHYLENVPEEFKPSSLAFGSAFHIAVEKVQEARMQGLGVPALDEILNAFDTAWSNETLGAEIQFCKEEDAQSLRELAQRMLSAYSEYAALESTLPEPAQIISIEHSNRFRLLADVPPIESRIDLLELQGSTDLIVSDLKSSRSRWNDTKVLEAIPQLVLYATGLLPLMRELDATRIVTKFVVVTKAKKPVVQVLQPQASQDDVVRLKQTITETWSAINAGIFRETRKLGLRAVSVQRPLPRSLILAARFPLIPTRRANTVRRFHFIPTQKKERRMPTESVTLYFRQGGSDKIYSACIEDKNGGHVVNFAFGRRGSTLQTGTKTYVPVSFDEAKKIYNKLVREKTGKGYTPGANGTSYSGTENAPRSTGILPQLLNPMDENQLERLFDDSAYLMQEKKDGRRVIIQADDRITGINRKGLTIGLPESIVKSAAEIGLPFIMDGEAIGDTYFAFDLLELSGTKCHTRPFQARLEMLSALIRTGVGSIKLVPAYHSPEIKRAEFALLKKAHAEGVVFKRVNAPYTPGRPASGGPQLKFKFVATGSFIVAGINAAKRSIGIDALNTLGQPQYVGNVTVPPNQKMPRVGALVEVRYLYAFREGCLFQPVLLSVRDDIDATACTANQLKFKPEEDDDAGV